MPPAPGEGLHGAIVRVDTPAWTDTLHLEWPRESGVDPSQRMVRRTGGIATDARLLALREMVWTDEMEICLVDASHAVRESDPAPLFWSPETCAHAHYRMQGPAPRDPQRLASTVGRATAGGSAMAAPGS
jgi:hypothetical protein